MYLLALLVYPRRGQPTQQIVLPQDNRLHAHFVFDCPWAFPCLAALEILVQRNDVALRMRIDSKREPVVDKWETDTREASFAQYPFQAADGACWLKACHTHQWPPELLVQTLQHDYT